MFHRVGSTENGHSVSVRQCDVPGGRLGPREGPPMSPTSMRLHRAGLPSRKSPAQAQGRPQVGRAEWLQDLPPFPPGE